MIKINCLILITGLSLLLSACNKDVEIKAQSKSPNEAALHDYSNVPAEQFKGKLSFFKEQLDKIFIDQKIILRDEGIAFAPTKSFLVVQIPVESLNEETYQRNIVPRIKDNGWILEKSIKNADVFCNGKKYQLEIIRPKDYSKEIINEEDRLTFTPIQKEWNIGMYYQEQGTLFCGDKLPVITIK
ncbi:hypothetical protein [Acinetobacter seifertii]|uniref:hypothetical protein n=1 Tax=Acinetobacter seifertii TaxID=1530123 RepID=UPI001F05C57B|nr:hypothetical protein [Acinetobacter seifertii]MCH2000276.1 hypothetical protein [Acinetobacter seifertii]